MDFTIDCSCGAKIHVSTREAGGTRECACGRVIQIPSLGELRRRAGRRRYDADVAAKLRYMFATGQLPQQSTCTRCGIETTNVLECWVECEKPYTRGRGFWTTFMLGICAPWILAVERLCGAYPRLEVLGRELVVNIPLAICPKCAARVGANGHDLRNLIHRVPLYSQLLKKYPNAHVGQS